MKRLGLLLLGFGYIVFLIESIHVGVAWWRGEIEQPGWKEGLMLASLPVLLWIWWQYLSPFGTGRGKCLLPEDEPPPR